MKDSLSSYFKRDGVISLLIFTAFSIIFLVLEVYNGRFWQSDFSVYYRTAERLLSGENLFRIADDGHYVFKYAPSSAVFFIPFTLFPLEIAKYIYWFFLSGVIYTGIYYSYRLVKYGSVLDSNRSINSVVIVSLLVLIVHLQRELHLGQVNQIIFLLFVLFTWSVINGKDIISGLSLALSLFFKPFGLILIPYLIVKKRFKALIALIVSCIVIFLLPLIFYGWDMFINQNLMWINELLIELGNKQDLMAPANHTIFAVIARYTGLGIIIQEHDLTGYYQILILAVIATWVLWFIFKGKDVSMPEISEVSILITLIPMLSFTSHNAFGFAEMSIIMLVFYFTGQKLYFRIAAIISFILIGGNYYDLWGKTLSTLFNDISLVTIGSVLVLILLSFLRNRKVI